MRLFATFLLLSFYGLSQFSDPANTRYWDASASLYARGFLGTADKHFAVCGESFLYFGANPYAGGFVVFSDSSGTNHWEKAYTAFNTEFSFENIAQWSDSSLLVGGGMLNPMTNLHGGALLMLDKNGNERWKGSIENGIDSPVSLRKTLILTDSTALIVGAKTTPGEPSFLMKIDSAGNKVWGVDLADPGGEILDLKSLTQLNNGDLVLCGNTTENVASGNGEWKGILIKTDSSGTMKWSKKFNQPHSGFSDIITDQTNLYLRTMGITSNGILAVDTSGTVLWQVDALQGDASWGPEKRRTLTFDKDSSLVFYFENFFSSDFFRVSRTGTTVEYMNALGRAAGYASHADSSRALLLCGPVYGVKSSLVTSEHFVVTRVDDMPQKASCVSTSSIECSPVSGFELLPYALTTGDSYSIQPALMEAASWFPTIDHSCVEMLGGLEEESANSFEIYPNPTNGPITIEVAGETNFYGNGSVTDAFGKTIYTFEVCSKILLDLHALDTGLYFIQIGEERLPLILE
jgi:hypothetical protein